MKKAHAEGVRLLETALEELGTAYALVKHGGTPEDRRTAFRLLSGVEGACAIVKLAIDPRLQKV